MHPQARLGLNRVEWGLGPDFEDSRRFMLYISFTSEAEFEAAVRYSEGIIMRTGGQSAHIYIYFNDYNSLLEKYTEEKLLGRIPIFNTAAFTAA